MQELITYLTFTSPIFWGCFTVEYLANQVDEGWNQKFGVNSI